MRSVGRLGMIAALYTVVLLIGTGGLVFRAHRDAGFALSQNDAVSVAIQLIEQGAPGLCTLAGTPDWVRGRQMPESEAERLIAISDAPISRPD